MDDYYDSFGWWLSNTVGGYIVLAIISLTLCLCIVGGVVGCIVCGACCKCCCPGDRRRAAAKKAAVEATKGQQKSTTYAPCPPQKPEADVPQAEAYPPSGVYPPQGGYPPQGYPPQAGGYPPPGTYMPQGANPGGPYPVYNAHPGNFPPPPASAKDEGSSNV